MGKKFITCYITSLLEAASWGVAGALLLRVFQLNVSMTVKIVSAVFLALCLFVGEGIFCFVQVIGREGQQAAKDTGGDIIKPREDVGKNDAGEPSKPSSPAKTDSADGSRKKVTSLVLLNEQGSVLLEWSLQSKTALIIGKSNGKDNVDVDLSGSAVADMVSKQHAVLNYTDNGWYIDDIDSKNGTRVKKKYQSALLDVKLVGAVEVEAGDIIYIANAMLQIR